MTQHFTEEGSVEIVNARMGDDINPRLKKVMASLVGHLHAFAKDVELTQHEWDVAIDFLTRTGHICSAERQEFILLSDVLGFSMLGRFDQQPQAARRHREYGLRSVPRRRCARAADG